jgi:hypothetical protein
MEITPTNTPTIYQSVPDTGSTTGVAGLLFVFTSFQIIKNNTIHAFKSKSLEGRVLAVHELIKEPLKLLIGALSAISLLSTAAKFLALSISVVITPMLLASCALIFAIASTVYLSMELIRSIVILKKSIQFINREQIGTVLDKIQLLDNLVGLSVKDVQLKLKQHASDLKKHLGEEEFKTLADTCTKSSDEIAVALKKARALLAFIKLDNLRNKYLPPAAEVRKVDYFSRRIGGVAAKAFSEKVEAISEYSLDTLKGMQDDNQIDAFIENGKGLLSMVDRQARKVLKVHALSVAVILLSGLGLAVSTKLITFSIAIFSAVISVAATVFGLIRSFSNDAYIDNAGDGFSLRLSIPSSLSPAEGKRVWSIWKTTDSNNPHLSRLAKCLYVFGSVASFGILPLFDGAVLNAQWIKKARGNGGDFHSNGAYASVKIPSLLSPPTEVTPSDVVITT